MYYSISAGSINPVPNSMSEFCIGRAKGTLHSKQNISWVDAGSPVLCVSSEQAQRGAPHTIDPSVWVGDNGEGTWLTFGSWSDYGDGLKQGARGGGVWMVELDGDNGMLKGEILERCGSKFSNCFEAEDEGKGGFVNVANHRGYDSPDGYIDGNSIEASYLWKTPSSPYWYLFTNWFWCCRGKESTYQIMVGRSLNPSGPFLDKDRKNMKDYEANATGTFVVEGGEGFYGPGHAGIWVGSGEEMIFTNHWEGSDSTGDVRILQATRMTMIEGWPQLLI